MRAAIKCLRRSAVEDEVVDGSRLDAGDLVLVGKGLDAGGKSRRGLLALEGQKVSTKTSNVGRSHRGSGDGVLEILSVLFKYQGDHTRR